MNRASRWTAVFAAALASLLLTACCVGGEEGSETVTRVASHTPGASAELSSVSPLAFTIVRAVEQRDEASLRALMITHIVPCVAEDSGQAGPFCSEGEALGTLTEVISVAVCQGGWSADIDQWVANIVATAGAPHALAQLTPGRADWPSELYGETVLVFAPRGSDVTRSVAIFLDDDGIVRSQIGCKRADDFLLDNEGNRLRVFWRAPSR